MALDGDRRWREVLDTVAAVRPEGGRVVVAGPAALAAPAPGPLRRRAAPVPGARDEGDG